MKKMQKLMKKFRNERGLTLVELLAVIVILAIIGTIAFVMVGNVTENAKKDAHIANAQQLIASAKLYDATEEPIDGSVTGVELNKAGMIEPLTNPWTKKPYDENTQGTVTKNNEGEYSVTLKADKCDLDDESEADIKTGDRDEICKGD